MKIKGTIFATLSAATLLECSCSSSDTDTDIIQSERSVIQDVSAYVQPFDTGDHLFGSTTAIYFSDEYMFFTDSHTKNDNIISAFDPKTMRYIGSFAHQGEGPEEVLVPGSIGINERENELYITDHGQQRIMGFKIDNALSDTTYAPFEKQRLDKTTFPDRYKYINDTLCIGRAILMSEVSGFTQEPCFYNMSTGEMHAFDTQNLRPEGMRSYMDASGKENRIVEAGINCDVIIVYDLSGKCIHRVLGPQFSETVNKDKNFFNSVVITDTNILALYDGEKKYSGKEIIMMDLNGKYICTLQPGFEVVKMSYFRPLDRLYMTLNDVDHQFAYIDLKSIRNLLK